MQPFRLRAEVYLDTGERETTKSLFDDLVADKVGIELAVGTELQWERLDEKRASRIATYRTAPNLAEGEDSTAARDWAAKSIVGLIDALDDRLRSREILSSERQGREIDPRREPTRTPVHPL